MNYVTRAAEQKFMKMNDQFKAVMVTGARQVGKTTMLKHLSDKQERTYVTLDNLMVRNLAKTDPGLFFQTYKPPVLIDEIQYAPELFEQIKIMCDASEETGRFWLTGSQKYSRIKNVRQSLAGRLGVLELFSLTRNEMEGIFFEEELDFSLPCLLERQRKTPKNDLGKVFEYIWRGGMPQIQKAGSEERAVYYESYIDCFIMRDITQLGGITDLVKFRKFIAACAAQVATQVNYKTLAEASDISQPTAKEWLSLLEGMGIVCLLVPYEDKALKRLTKTAKLYFYDTGLCAHLSRWTTQEALCNGAASECFFECFVISEIIKNFMYTSTRASLAHFRDAKAKEIDLLVTANDMIYPFEIKMSANADPREIKKFSILNKATANRGPGGVLCMCQEVVPIDDRNCFIPVNLI
jgi:predicted AAA+ superfamily ATPase